MIPDFSRFVGVLRHHRWVCRRDVDRASYSTSEAGIPVLISDDDHLPSEILELPSSRVFLHQPVPAFMPPRDWIGCRFSFRSLAPKMDNKSSHPTPTSLLFGGVGFLRCSGIGIHCFSWLWWGWMDSAFGRRIRRNKPSCLAMPRSSTHVLKSTPHPVHPSVTLMQYSATRQRTSYFEKSP